MQASKTSSSASVNLFKDPLLGEGISHKILYPNLWTINYWPRSINHNCVCTMLRGERYAKQEKRNGMGGSLLVFVGCK